MSSPKQTPLPNIRPPNSAAAAPPQLVPPMSSGSSGTSPYGQQPLPPPPITSSSGSSRPSLSSTTSRPLPPPGMGGASGTDMPPPYHTSPSMSTPSPMTSSYANTQSMPSLPSPNTLPGSSGRNSNNTNTNNSSSSSASKPSLPPIPLPPSTNSSRGSGAPPLPSSSSFPESNSGPLPPRSQAASPPAPPLMTQPSGRPQQQQTPTTTLSTASTNTTTTTNNNNNNNSSNANSSSNNNNSNNNNTGGYRPLNVRDALTYLDQVKVQFSAHPDVYNQFLDIMKDFKSQAIDTPGVIERVSILFNGHPDLISGFNTFLPPGYRIECSSDPNEPDIIKVTTPSGTTHKRTSRPVGSVPPPHLPQGPGPLSQRREPDMVHGSAMGGVPPPPPPHHQQQQQPGPPPTAAGSYYQAPYGHLPPHHPHQPPPPPPTSASSIPPPQSMPPSMTHPIHPLPPQPQSTVTSSAHGYVPPGASSSRRPPPPPPLTNSSAAASQDQSDPPHMTGSSSGGGTRKAPVEFNHAINYVNKIKNRYAGDPETYKQFLEILQTYQKERKPIQEVYTHVQYLFNGAPDLLHEFKQFLPEITGQPAPEFLDEIEPSYTSSKRLYVSAAQNQNYLPPGKKKKTGPKKKNQKAGMEEDLIAGYPASSYFDPARPTISAEEVELFEQIRKHIGNKPSYEEFLKTLNLYTQQIIDADGLMKQVEGFLGSDRELFDWFKSVVAVDLKDQVIERPSVIVPKPDLNHCPTVDNSPSYRLVSKDWQNQPCSGRDQLCWEVLNDEYVSHPIWASEDSGFVASKKNAYEEAMHRCEEERYDYDLNIDANLNTIALLVPLAKQIEAMTDEEKESFKLSPGLGGQSVTIYERIIKKVYPDELGQKVINVLYEHPDRAVPILLNRLSLKDEEWRKAQHEYNKIWRESDAKNFYRALDYQGTSFKSNDRKGIAQKALVLEIENLHDDFRENEVDIKDKDAYPLQYIFPDQDVFRDVTRLIFSYIEKQNGFSSNDRRKIRNFINVFIPLFFHVGDVIPEGYSIESEDEEDASADEDDEGHSINTEDSDADMDNIRSPRNRRSRSPSTTPTTRRRNGRSRTDDHNDTSADLLRGVLTKKNKNPTSADDGEAFDKSPSAQRDTSTTPAPEEGEDFEADTNQRDESYDDSKPIKTEDPSSADERENMNGGAASSSSPQDMSADEKPNNAIDATNGVECDEKEEQASVTGTATAGTTKSNNDVQNPEGNHLFAAAAAATAPNMNKRTSYSFFCNNAFYTFFRLYQLTYERLNKMKKLDEDMKSNPNKGKKINKVAHELDLYTSRFDDIDISIGYYNSLLDLIDRYFNGDFDQNAFEEKARYIFVTDAYVLFTIDKLIQSIVKQVQTFAVDDKCGQLVDLFRSDQTLESTCPRITSVYRLRAEEVVGADEYLYKVNFNTEANKMSIQLLDKDDDMLEPSSQDHYENYVASYMDWANSTEGIDVSKMHASFLQRNWKPHDRHLSEITVQSQLQYKVSQENYHMYYIIGTEDAFVRPPISSGNEDKDKIEEMRKSKWHEWLESRATGWAKNIESDDAYNSMEADALKLLSEKK
ncbi:hypothetical protein BDA99DRAFT_485496 [Phascolomyces articulosus]|uniref:Histone deacetylase interacting domain-containing protein n=1 Tax=Phascolomyces articulosus TaxID=60185 RepID=A0AAD5PBH8_9FUNG|nr:hypothetical protein BDA99DRAFT_485496 [Phascolomyces articulosus]